MIHKMVVVSVLCLGLLLLGAGQAYADLIPSITASCDRGTAAGFNIANLVNGMGLPGNVPALTGQHWYASADTVWESGPPMNVTFDLHGEYIVTGMSVWPFNGNGQVSAKDVQVSYSSNGVNFTLVPGAPTQFPLGPNVAPVMPAQYTFSAVTATHMRFYIMNNWGYTSPSGWAYTGLAEVQFDGAPVPEPASLGLLGFGIIALLRRRSR